MFVNNSLASSRFGSHFPLPVSLRCSWVLLLDVASLCCFRLLVFLRCSCQPSPDAAFWADFAGRFPGRFFHPISICCFCNVLIINALSKLLLLLGMSGSTQAQDGF